MDDPAPAYPTGWILPGMLDYPVRLLSPVRLTGPLGTVRPGPARARAMLAALALRPNRVVSQSRLAEILWERPPASSRPNIRTLVAALRSALRRAGLEAGVGVATRRSTWGGDGGYCMEIDPGLVDVLAIGDVIRSLKRRCRDDPSGALKTCREALAADLGGFGADFPCTPWFEPTLVALREHKSTLERLSVYLRMLVGEHRGALVEARTADSYRDRADPGFGVLCVALSYLAGSPLEALAEHREITAHYRGHGMDVPEPLQRLQAAVLNDDRGAVTAAVHEAVQRL